MLPLANVSRLLFTGYGALEGALLSLLLFSLLVPRLPSLSSASDSTKAFVKYRVMTHNAAWVLLGLVLLFPEDAHAGMSSLPPHPTLPVEGWGIFLVVALFSLLVMMAGEIVAASSHLASTNETRLLFDRAILKSLVALVLAWLLLFQTEAVCPNLVGSSRPRPSVACCCPRRCVRLADDVDACICYP